MRLFLQCNVMWQVKMRHLVVTDSDLVKYLGYGIGCNSIQWLIKNKIKIINSWKNLCNWTRFFYFILFFYNFLLYNFLLFVLFFNFSDPIQWLLFFFILSNFLLTIRCYCTLCNAYYIVNDSNLAATLFIIKIETHQ